MADLLMTFSEEEHCGRPGGVWMNRESTELYIKCWVCQVRMDEGLSQDDIRKMLVEKSRTYGREEKETS